MCFHFSCVNTTGMELLSRCLFNFIKKTPCSFPKWLYHLTLQQFMRIPVVPHSKHVILSILLISATPIGMKCHLFMHLLCIFLTANDVE